MVMASGMTRAPTAMSAKARETMKQNVVSLRDRLIRTAQTTITFPMTDDTAITTSIPMYRALEEGRAEEGMFTDAGRLCAQRRDSLDASREFPV